MASLQLWWVLAMVLATLWVREKLYLIGYKESRVMLGGWQCQCQDMGEPSIWEGWGVRQNDGGSYTRQETRQELLLLLS